MFTIHNFTKGLLNFLIYPYSDSARLDLKRFFKVDTTIVQLCYMLKEYSARSIRGWSFFLAFFQEMIMYLTQTA